MSFTILDEDDANKRPMFSTTIPEHATTLTAPGGKFHIHTWMQELPGGKMKQFETASRSGDTIVVIPVLKNGNILITYENQPLRTAPYLCVVRGLIEAGQSPTDAAICETKQETGYTSGAFQMLSKRAVHPRIDLVMYLGIMRELDDKRAQELDGGEEIEIREVSVDDFIDKALNEEFDEHEIHYYVAKLVAIHGREGAKAIILGK